MGWASELQLLTRDHQKHLMMEQPYNFDAAKHHLGQVCKSNHYWLDTDLCLRRLKDNRCVQCLKDKARRHYTSHRDEVIAKVRQYQCDNRDPYRERSKHYMRTRRAKLVASGLTGNGLPRKGEINRMITAIKNAGRCPSVPELVMREQRRYWASNPEAKTEHYRRWAQLSWWLQYATDPRLRFYHREKSKRRKAIARGNTAVMIKPQAIITRFNDFENACAYCGSRSSLQLEHIVPISKGGAHDISNIVPACRSCNFSKHASPMESWYRDQPFFCELRLRRIQRVMAAPLCTQFALDFA